MSQFFEVEKKPIIFKINPQKISAFDSDRSKKGSGI